MEILLESTSDSSAVQTTVLQPHSSSRIHYHMLKPQRHTTSIKNQEILSIKTKTSTNSDIQDLTSRYQDYQDKDYQKRLLASFPDDAKYEQVGQGIISRDGKDVNVIQGKDLRSWN
ncbi:hypothetical protein Tco_0669400 [Tanacetum coccineum]